MTRWLMRALALLVILVGVGVALSWAPDRPVETLKARWAPPPSTFITVDGLSVHLRDEGPRDDPQPIVLLHGTSASLHTWEAWAGALKGQHRVIRFDLPGFGLTGPNADHVYTQPRYSQFVVAMLDALQVKRATLVGNSLGGAIAWKTALDFPDRVARLVLVDSGGYPNQATSVPIGFRMAATPELAPLMDRILPRSAVESSVRSVYGDPAKVTPALIDRYYELALREGNRQALRDRFAQSKGGEYADQVKQIRQPTLLIWGSQDHLIPPALGERFKGDIPGSRLVILDGLGHVPQEEDPARSVAALQAFLNETSHP